MIKSSPLTSIEYNHGIDHCLDAYWQFNLVVLKFLTLISIGSFTEHKSILSTSIREHVAIFLLKYIHRLLLSYCSLRYSSSPSHCVCFDKSIACMGSHPNKYNGIDNYHDSSCHFNLIDLKVPKHQIQ